MKEPEALFNCLQAVLWFCLKDIMDPDFLFINCFGMDFDEEKGSTLSERIKPFVTINMQYFLEDLFGIEFIDLELKDCYSPDTENFWYVVHADGYNCEWNSFYQKNHISHFFILDERDDNSKGFYANDPYLQVESRFISDEQMRKGFIGGFKMSKQRKRANVTEINKSHIKKYLFDWVDKDRLKNDYLKAIEMLKSLDNNGEVVECKSADICRGVIMSKQILNNYYAIKQIIGGLNDLNDKKNKLVESIEHSCLLWQCLNLYFIRITVDKRKEKTISKMLNVFEELVVSDCSVVDFFYASI